MSSIAHSVLYSLLCLDWRIWNGNRHVADRLKVKKMNVWTGAYGRVNSLVPFVLSSKNSLCLDWRIWNRKKHVADRLKVKTNHVWTGAYGRVTSLVANRFKLKK